MVDLFFAKFWEATVVTFRVIAFLIRSISWSISAVLNRKQNQPPRPTADLFEPEASQKPRS